jgi:hypothetical protein
MRFYVPVGPLGVVFRIGMVLTGVTGGLVYNKASRRRASTPAWSCPSDTPFPAETRPGDAYSPGSGTGLSTLDAAKLS